MSKGNPKVGGSGFITFSSITTTGNDINNSVKSSASVSHVVGTISPIYTGNDNDLSVACKKILKKDSITKLKAINEILVVITNENHYYANIVDDILNEFLPFFVYVYVRLVLDNDRKIREKINFVLYNIIVIDKRLLGPYMKILIGPWWLCIADPFIEVSKLALDSFHMAILPKKRQSVLSHLSSSMFDYILKNFEHTVETLSDISQCTREEAEDRYERVIISSLECIKIFIEILNDEENLKLIQVGAVCNNDEIPRGYKSIINEKLWKKTFHNNDRIRKATYKLLYSTFTKLPSLYETKFNWQRLANIIVNMLDESNTNNLVEMYNLILMVCSNHIFATEIWKYIDIPIDIMPKLLLKLNNSRNVTLQYITSLIGLFPVDEVSISSINMHKIKIKNVNRTEKDLSVHGSTVIAIINLVDNLYTIKSVDQIDLFILERQCIIEISTLLLLRKCNMLTNNVNCDYNLMEYVTKIMQHYVLNSLNDIMGTVYRTNVRLSVFDSVKQCLIQLYRGTLKEINFNLTQWTSLFWDLFLNDCMRHICNFIVPKEASSDVIIEKVTNFLIVTEYMHSVHCAILSEDNKENIGSKSIANEIIDNIASTFTDMISQKLILYDNDYNSIRGTDLIEFTTIIRSLLLYGKSNKVSLLKLHSSEWICCISKWIYRNIDTSDDVSSIFIFRHIIDQIKCIFLDYLPIVDEDVMNVLLENIVNGKSVLCFNLIIGTKINIAQLRVNSDYVAIFLSTCKSFIANTKSEIETNFLVTNHSNDKILFIIQLVHLFNSKPIVDEIVELLVHDNSFISDCVILSLYFIYLNQPFGINAIHGGIVIPPRIIEDEVYIRNIMILVMLTNNTKPSFHYSNEFIYSWYDLRVKLIPLINTSTLNSFISDAEHQLTVLFNDETGHHNSFIHEWCQKVIDLIHILIDKSNSISQLNKLPIFDHNHWKSKNKNYFLCTAFQRIDELYEQSYSKPIFSILPIDTYIDLYWEILDSNLNNQDNVCSNLALSILRYVSDLSFEEKVILFKTMVRNYEANYSSKKLGNKANKIFISLIESLVSSEKVKSSIINSNTSIGRLEIDIILSNDILVRGQELYYINFASNEVESAVLLETHRESGIEPYYTIHLLDSDKEIQTERCKLLLSRPKCFKLGNVFDKDLGICDILCQWMNSNLFPLFSDIRNNNTPDEILIDLLCQLYFTLCNTCYDSLIIRDMCLMYKELILDIFVRVKPNITNISYGLKLLTEVFSSNANSNVFLSKIVIGNGFWLLLIFQSLKSISKNMISTKSADDNNLMLMVSIFNVIIMFAENFQMRECHQHVLSCIQYVVLMEKECNRCFQELLQNCLFNCCRIYWNERNLLLSCTNIENNPFLIKYYGTEFSNIEVSALSTIVNCFLKDEVNDNTKNQAASAIMTCFYSKDIHLSNGILNKISVDKDYISIESKLISIISNTSNYRNIVLAATKLLEIITSLAVSPFFVEIINSCNTFINNEVEKDASSGNLIDSIKEDTEIVELESNKILLGIVGSQFLITEILKSIDIISASDELDEPKDHFAPLLLLWIILLQKIDTCSTVSGLSSIRARCGLYLHHNGILQKILGIILQHSKDFLQFKSLLKSYDTLLTVSDNNVYNFDDKSIQCIIIYSLYRTICTFPAMIRTWWSNECNRFEKQRVSKFIESTVRKPLLNRELLIIENAFLHKMWDPSVFTIKGSSISGELCASLIIEDGPKVELNITVPASYPLNNVEVEITKIGIAENRTRRWILQIIQLLSMQDGTVLDALLMWKKNVEKELDGIEPCPICYSILHPKSMSLPKLKCPTCNNKFHNQCLFTWFKSSGKSKCVVCQQPMYN